MKTLRNRVAQTRAERGLTQAELAQRAGITRQSLSAIEAGRSAPSVAVALALAQLLERRTEELFTLDDKPGALEAELSEAPLPPGDAHHRVVVAEVGGRWVAHALHPDEPLASVTPADGLAHRARGGAHAVRVGLFADRDSLPSTLLCAGCAPALGLLLARSAGANPGARALWLDRSSSRALELLARGEVHVAGAHLFDEASGEYNVPFVERRFEGEAMKVVALARWEAGLVVPAGNPKRLKGVADLARAGLRVVRREEGSGAQRLLERLAAKAGLDARSLLRAGPAAASHQEAARAVALGLADAAVAVRDAAQAHGLGFLPLAEERFDLVIPAALLEEPRVGRLLDTLSGRAFRREAEALGGYALREAGTVIAETGRGGEAR